MKIRIIPLLCILIFLISCSDSEPTLEHSVNQVSIKTESRYLIANNISTVPIKIETNLNPLETTQLNIEYFANGELIDSNFKTNVAGIYTIWAEVNSIKSNEIVLNARPLDNQYDIFEFKVIFHVVNSEVESNDIYQALDQLNRTFRMASTNPDPNSVDTFFQFKLAEKDPEGTILEETGIKRHEVNPSNTIHFEDWMWDIYWDPDYYINVWIGDTGSNFSHATYPITNCNGIIDDLGCSLSNEVNYLHGIALRTNAVKHRRNNLISHEMGHFFGLYHIFSNNCNVANSYDYCDDTPTYNREQYESNSMGSFRISCDDMEFRSWNIMDYGDQDLRIAISYDQRKRMRTILENSKWSGLIGAQAINSGKSELKKHIKKPKNYKLTQKHIIN